jgi:hypothetical protein
VRFDAPTPKQHKILDRTLAYYRDSDWGWGEHMSDIYARVIQDELLALYMWGPSATAGQKQAAWDLFLELVAIDDVFDKGPRVPAIRTYSATRSPSDTPYRKRLTPWTGPEDNMWQPLRAMACQNGIPALLPEQPEPPRHTEIACYGGARALVTRSDTWRLGAMSRYQIMDGIDHPGWGLAWQSMPVAYWTRIRLGVQLRPRRRRVRRLVGHHAPCRRLHAARGRQERRDSQPPLDRRRLAPFGHRPGILRSHEGDGSRGTGELGGPVKV